MKYLQDNKDNYSLHNQYILLRRELRNQIMSNDKCSNRLYSKLRNIYRRIHVNLL